MVNEKCNWDLGVAWDVWVEKDYAFFVPKPRRPFGYEVMETGKNSLTINDHLQGAIGQLKEMIGLSELRRLTMVIYIKDPQSGAEITEDATEERIKGMISIAYNGWLVVNEKGFIILADSCRRVGFLLDYIPERFL